jgi:hypothetical protein
MSCLEKRNKTRGAMDLSPKFFVCEGRVSSSDEVKKSSSVSLGFYYYGQRLPRLFGRAKLLSPPDHLLIASALQT